MKILLVSLTEDELKFLQACYNDSSSEGCFDRLFEEIDFPEIEKSLVGKGVLKKEED